MTESRHRIVLAPLQAGKIDAPAMLT